MNPLFDRRAHERLQRVDAELSQSAPGWRRSPSADLRERILAKIDAAREPDRPSQNDPPERARPAILSRTGWLALAAALLIAWLAWQAPTPQPRDERRVVYVSAESLVRQAWQQLKAPSIARSLDRPLIAEVDHMRADAQRAVDFLVARVSLPMGTRGRGD